MALLPIKIYGEPVLRDRAREVTREEIDATFRQWIADMGETMYDAAGVGLAANQVGDLRRVFVADVAQTGDPDGPRKRGRRDPNKRELLTFLNPEILESSAEDEPYNEGCLSIPEIEHDVFRPIRVRVRYRTLDWELQEGWIGGLLARVFQHELDHLDGVMFIDHLPEAERRKLAGALSKLKRATEDSSVVSGESKP